MSYDLGGHTFKFTIPEEEKIPKTEKLNEEAANHKLSFLYRCFNKNKTVLLHFEWQSTKLMTKQFYVEVRGLFIVTFYIIRLID